MLQNPIHLRLERLESWQHVTFMACLCERIYPAIDACVALSELVHSRLSGETLEHAVEVSKTSITTVAMLEMTQAGREMSDEELKENPAVEQEWDIQWEIFRLLAECEERDIELIKGLRADLREAGESNIGMIFQQ
ncbi:YjaG family protein [Escherichia coli]